MDNGQLAIRKNSIGLVKIACAAVLLLSSVGAVFAGADNKVPQTAEEHLALAKSYQEKVVSYRQEAETHRQMLAAYKERVINNPKAPENGWMKKMREHCEGYIKNAEEMAAGAQQFADYHTLRAKELQGQ